MTVMRRLRLAYSIMILLLALTLTTASCTDPPASPTTNAPFSQTDLVIGTGAAIASGNTLTVDYTGWLYEASAPDHKGLPFDSTLGKTPFVFALGSGQVIAGWEQGLPGMQAGGVRRLVIPPSLGYGATRSGAIPPNSTLVFDITLDSFQ